MNSERELMEGILLGKTDDLKESIARASPDEKRRAVFWAASSGNSAALEAVARSIGSAEARRKFFADLRDGKVRTPLHVASNRQIAWQLWRLGCSPTARDGNGRTPAQAAMESVKFEIRDFLANLEKTGSAERPTANEATLDLCVEAENNLWTNLEA